MAAIRGELQDGSHADMLELMLFFLRILNVFKYVEAVES